MQMLSLAWFVFAAQAMSELEFGLLASGLALVVLFGAVGDLGLSRTIVRYIAPDPSLLWPTFRRAVYQRSVGAVIVGLVGIAVFSSIDVELSFGLILVSALIAWSGGLSELVFSAFRSVGRLRTEARIVIAERVVFAAIAVPLVISGGGAVAVLSVYAVTNCASALYGFFAIRRTADCTIQSSRSLLDAEGRRTAFATLLVALGFKTSALLLVVLGTTTAVGSFSIAQRAPEALALLGIAAAGPVLAIARTAVAAGDRRRAVESSIELCGILLLVMSPALAWFVFRPETSMDVLFDSVERSEVTAVLPILAIAAVLWIVRTVGETILLADERARRYMTALAMGVTTNVVLGAILIRGGGATEAAVAALVAEAIVVSIVIASSRTTLQQWRPLVPALASGLLSSVIVLTIFDGLPQLAEFAVIGLLSFGTSLLGWRRLHRIDGAGPQEVSATTPILASSSGGTTSEIEFSPSSTE